MISDFSRIHRKYRKTANLPKGLDHDTDTTHVESAPTAPYTAYTGATLLKGKALAAEIENYRRRAEALLHFFDLVAPQWWDKLYPFKDEMVQRPSRSADRLRLAENRLNVRLARLTPRMIMPAAAAVASIEERDLVTVLPRNLVQGHNLRGGGGIPTTEKMENIREQLNLAFSISRRLGEIERLKQQIILHAMDWIYADGNDLNVRSQRFETLAKYIQPCLIEHHEGVQALITHYFRRRSNPFSDIEGRHRPMPGSTEDPKLQLKYAFNAITAANISTTNRAILNMLEAESRFPKKTGEPQDRNVDQQIKSKADVDSLNMALDDASRDASNPSVVFMSQWSKQQLNTDGESADPKPNIGTFSLPTEWLSYGDGGLMGRDYEATTLDPENPENDISAPEEGVDDLEAIRRRLGSDLIHREAEANLRFSMKKRSTAPLSKGVSLLSEYERTDDSLPKSVAVMHGGEEHFSETDKSTKTMRNVRNTSRTPKPSKPSQLGFPKGPRSVRLNMTPLPLGEGLDILSADFRKLLIEQKSMIKKNPLLNARQQSHGSMSRQTLKTTLRR